MPEDIAIRFILNTSPQSTLPISKYLHKGMKLDEKDREKLNKRLDKFQSLSKLQESTPIPKMHLTRLDSELNQSDSAISFLNSKDGIKPKIKMAFLIHNIKLKFTRVPSQPG